MKEGEMCLRLELLRDEILKKKSRKWSESQLFDWIFGRKVDELLNFLMVEIKQSKNQE